jgi:hypothetical protein
MKKRDSYLIKINLALKARKVFPNRPCRYSAIDSYQNYQRYQNCQKISENIKTGHYYSVSLFFTYIKKAVLPSIPPRPNFPKQIETSF